MTPIEVAPGVTVHPDIRGGEPCVAGVPTRMYAERFQAGEAVAELACDYGLPPEAIEAALRWELLSRRARKRRVERALRAGEGSLAAAVLERNPGMPVEVDAEAPAWCDLGRLTVQEDGPLLLERDGHRYVSQDGGLSWALSDPPEPAPYEGPEGDRLRGAGRMVE